MDGPTPTNSAQPELDVPRIEVRDITKRYGSLHVLRGVSMSIRAGEIVGLVGDNGAGKSTLVHIICGALQRTSGTVLLDGKEIDFKSPIEARNAGIETVYQDLALAPDLNVWQNVFLGREKAVGGPLRLVGWLDRKYMAGKAREHLDRTKIRMPGVSHRADQLSGGQRQAVAVGRAIGWGARVVLLDEPTAALGVEQQQQVAELTKTIAAEGMAVLLISHNIPQVYDICHHINVLFQGEIVADLRPEECEIDDVIGWITGSALAAKKS
jgi:ABC-type sugar transport system ATPase subunit